MKRIVTYLALVFGFAGFLAAGLMAARRPSTTTVAKEPERLWEQYTVRSNETLRTLSVQFGVSPRTLMEMNGLGKEPLLPGQVLVIPKMTSIRKMSEALQPVVTNAITNAVVATITNAGAMASNNVALAVAKQPLRILKCIYDGQESITLVFSTTPDHNVLSSYIKVTPEPRGALTFDRTGLYGSDPETGREGWCPSVRVTGDYLDNTNFVLSVRAGIAPENFGKYTPLTNDYTKTFRREPRPSKVNFVHFGRYLPPGGRRALELESVNITNVRVRVAAVPPANVVNLLALENDAYKAHEGNSADSAETQDFAGEITNVFLRAVCRRNEPERLVAEIGHPDGARERGIFLMGVGNGDLPMSDNEFKYWSNDNPHTYRLVCVSDLALSVRQETDGLYAWVTSFTTGRPVADTDVKAYSSAGVLVYEGRTDKSGLCRLARRLKGEPFAVVASAADGSDATFLALHDQMTVEETIPSPEGARGIYLKPKELTAFVWTERGIYRHGEKVFLHAILRDGSGVAPRPLPVEVRVLNPDGEFFAKANAMSDAFGAVTVESMAIPADQPSGIWTFEVRTPGKDGTLIDGGTREVKIEEFAPPQIRVKVRPDETTSLTNFAFTVSAEHLFGGAARGLRAEGAIVFEDVAFAPTGWSGWTFGDAARGLKPCFRVAAKKVLDDKGQARIEAPLWESAGRPRAAVRVTAQGTVFEDGGRPATSRASQTLHYYPHYVGIKAGHWVQLPANGFAKVALACVQPNGSRVTAARTLEAKVESINCVYSCRRSSRGWMEWTSDRVVRTVKEGIEVKVESGRDGLVEIPVRAAGEYRLTVRDPQADVSSSVEFYLSANGSDHAVRAAMNEPTEVSLTPVKKLYRPGERPQLLVKSPFTGAALLSVMRDRVTYVEVIELTNATQMVTLRAAERSWAPNVDVAISVVQGVAASARNLAVRAHGQATVRVRDAADEIPVKVDAAVRLGGGTSATAVKVKVAAPKGERLAVTVVDEGINLLTDEKTPDPINALSMPRTAAHALYDLYSRVLPVIGTRTGDLRKTGVKTGGGMGTEMLSRVSPVPTRRFKPLALWRRDIAVTNGVAEVEIALPEFVGEVRVTAVAYSRTASGAASLCRKVAHKALMQPDAPRFVAPGDGFEITLPLHNRSDAEGEIGWAVTARGAVALDDPASASGKVKLAKDGSTVITVRAHAAKKTGEGAIGFEVRGFGERHVRTIDLPVRPATGWTEHIETVTLNPGESRTLTARPDPKGLPEAVRQSVAVSGSPLQELAGALAFLEDYPYGCLEQTSSRVFPLIAAGGLLNTVPGFGAAASNRTAYVHAGVKRAESMIRWNDFTMWPDTDYEPWDREVSLYATHFLIAAEKAGETLADSTKTALKRFLDKWMVSPSAAISAYACHTLALWGKAPKDRMLRLFDTRANLDLLSRARLARAFALAGDRERASELMKLGAENPQTVRDAAFTALALLELDPNDARLLPLTAYLAKACEGRYRAVYTTVDAAHALLALGAYYRHHPVKPGEPKVKFAAAGWKGTLTNRMCRAVNGPAAIAVKNVGAGTGHLSWRWMELAQPATTNVAGVIRLERRYLKGDGTEANLADLVRGELIIAELKLTTGTSAYYNDLVITDLFPAAFEPVHAALSVAQYPWFKEAGDDVSWVMRADARDDRMLVFSKRFYLVAEKPVYFRYPLRVVNGGDFTLPGATLEAMYAPGIRSETAASRLKVTK